ncbi:hypothetical protein [Thermocoleostomius sinensis]|uniref:Uncharacterized protein n=1 Tax=Thermocoleostomius sinensis A174 TaxID=2016057 RepID=A0A9E9C728_9CYAN|nr:hypothetical protein [Thermocoleostomius sinensis]WAL59899.1 hypothetical protein OXH18_22445 [Thermocoleostomius sinensis A174]
MPSSSGRDKEVKLIRQANRASATARLMLGKFDDWHEFLKADTIDLENLPRRNLKSGSKDVKRRLSREIEGFCSRNFQNMTERKLAQLYEEIKAHRGFEIPLLEFESQFSPLNPKVLKGRPKHLTVCISLWGLQFKFPEEEMAKDLIEALNIVVEAEASLKDYKSKHHSENKENRIQISKLIRQKSFASRSVVINCFNLIEAYLNGLAWDYVQTNGIEHLSNRKKSLLEDTTQVSTRDKLTKYPMTITGNQLWEEPDDDLEAFISTLKPFRDSLMHPSPFSAPERHGGYDKLSLFYRVDYDTGLLTAKLLVDLVKRIQKHIYGERSVLPVWIDELDQEIQKCWESLESERHNNPVGAD